MADFITYQEQLEMPEWQSKRAHIMNRDRHRCRLCERGESTYTIVNGKHLYLGIDYSINISSQYYLPNTYDIEEFKRLLGIDSIRILRYHGDYIAITSNGAVGFLFVKDTKKIPSVDKLKVKFLTLPTGTLSFVISDSEELLSINFGFYTSENKLMLNVHHQYYILGCKAWEYMDNELVTLCSECHTKVHKNLGVKVYSRDSGHLKEIILTPCTRCSGTGYFPEYKKIENGVCFRCRGRRFEEYISTHD